MRIADLLTEGRDAPLFHFTRLVSLLGHIIPSDTLGNPNSDGVSLTRDANTPYFSHGFWDHVCLVLDQTALAANYAFEPSGGDAYSSGSFLFKKSDLHGSRYKESEEFVARPIRPLHRYLRAIVVSDTKVTAGIVRVMKNLRKGKDFPKTWDKTREFVKRQMYVTNANADFILEPERWFALFDYCDQHGIAFQQTSLRLTGTPGFNLWHNTAQPGA